MKTDTRTLPSDLLAGDDAPSGPLVPQALFALGARAYTPLRARRWRRAGCAVPQQAHTLDHWQARAAATAYGRLHGVEAHMTYGQFQQRLPLRSYEAFAPWIDRMKRGEADVLWPGRCAHYAVSSGTTAGRTKYLPITPAMLEHFRQAGLDSLMMYTARVGSARIFRGRQLFLGGATALNRLPDSSTFEAFGGDLSGITALNLPRWAEQYLYEPGREIAQLADWPTKLQAIARRCASRNITVLAGIPSWLLILAETLRAHAEAEGRPFTRLRELWPNLECLIHGGVPIAPFAGELRQALGPGVHFHEVYPASEGFIAAQDADSAHGLRLMTGSGLFFEFLPMSVFDESRLEQLGQYAVPLADVQPGVDYALLLTTPAGLSRYVIGDVVRFISTEPPRLIYVGRTKLQLSAFGEHVIEKELTDALTTVCAQHCWSVVNFHVAPVFVSTEEGRQRGRHEWWIEIKPGAEETPSAPVLGDELDAELQLLNEDYEVKRQGGGLEPPVVRLVPSGFFAQWLSLNGKWGGQNKMPRCRSDRAIADDFARMARARR
ncbi:MAG TPA: GH3 auxin-responsive promoter family protein [Opitutaceae bacterium]|nr:GH3 auxin-responsive promoter family protein [Opitutaceae bacterium]HOR26167.1 GH3 auxin-responsive promoter family protein [Opitutaceae bacterium]HPK50621.1 GH3 auxin-responsive promoter family protein [Opitutaceae bacterium]